jgi:acetyl-CoA carboxylase biotin carboxylase subunit
VPSELNPLNESTAIFHYRGHNLKKFKRVLIANRGEIAVRIIRALRELEIESVAIYSDPDRSSLHVKMADYSYNIPGSSPADTYLNIPQIIDAIKATGADAVHPGYGFLSENASFVGAIAALGAVTFIGPSQEAMNKLGDKIKARELMTKNGVPMVPGLARPLVSVDDLKSVAHELGYPLILKAAAGGGGRGMRVVRKDDELKDAFEACSREAVAYFGNPDVFCERYIEHPRHIEIQVMFDKNGHGLALFERDCTIQRRHQKLIEEAPSIYLNSDQRNQLCQIGIQAGLAAGYSGAGTIEFICESPDKCYFMEMNTRIQVEHPVTEMITGIDLIKLMIRVAYGESLPVKQNELRIHGHAIEARINAEDPQLGFLPSPGIVKSIRFPSGPFVRVDTHLYPGYEIPPFYDSMVAKLIVWGENREEALVRLRRALNDFEISGVPTTIKFHEALLSHPKYQASDVTTRFIEETETWFSEFYERADGKANSEELALLTAVLAVTESQIESNIFTHDRKNWQIHNRLEGVGRRQS